VLLGSNTGVIGSLDAISIMSLRLNAVDDPTGLDRAFLVAGVPSVIGSKWDIDDQIASELIELFYRELDRGASKAEALRCAQVAVRKKHATPNDWAAFSLTGDAGAPVLRNNVVEKLTLRLPTHTRDAGRPGLV
jgi:CHAT domain